MEQDAQIPARVRELLAEKVRSIEELEILIWFRSNSSPCAALEVGRALRLPVASIAEALAQLVSNQMIDVHVDERGAEMFLPAANALADVDALARAYEESRVEMLVLISSNAIGRVRRGALHTFSEAFRLRGGKKDG